MRAKNWAIAALVGLAVILAGCKKKRNTTGIPECDAYLLEYRCFLEKTMGNPSQADQTASTVAESYKKAASNPLARSTVAQSCSETQVTMQAQFLAAGCGPGGIDITPVAAAPTASASAGAAPSETTTHNAPAPPPHVLAQRGGTCKKKKDCASGLSCVNHPFDPTSITSTFRVTRCERTCFGFCPDGEKCFSGGLEADDLLSVRFCEKDPNAAKAPPTGSITCAPGKIVVVESGQVCRTPCITDRDCGDGGGACVTFATLDPRNTRGVKACANN
jgi:hypothetical protein